MVNSKVMVVEDEWVLAERLKNDLTDLGYTVTSMARSGNESIRNAKKESPDLVLMDIVLQGEMDGVQTAARLRKDLKIPVVFLTAYDDKSILERAKKTKPYGFLIKPIGEKELYATIEVALYKHKMEKEKEKLVKRLEESEEKYREFVDCADDLITRVDGDGKLTYVNDASKAVFGIDKAKCVGRSAFDFVYDEDRAATCEWFNKQIKSLKKRGTIENRQISLTGEVRNMLWTSNFIYDENGKVKSVNGIARDITKRKRDEESLRRSALEYETLSKVSSFLIKTESEAKIYSKVPRIIMENLDFDIVVIENCDEQSDEIIFKGSFGDPNGITKDIRKPAVGTISGDAIKARKAITIDNIEKCRLYKLKKAGKAGIKSFACFPMMSNNNAIGSICFESRKLRKFSYCEKIILQAIADAIGLSIEKKRAECKLNEHKQHLEKLVDERTSKLKAAQESLAHSDKLSASIAHEFNNPICGIRNVLQALNKPGFEKDESRGKFIELAIKECDRMAGLIKKLQVFHRPSSGEFEIVDIHEAIDDIALIYKKRLKERGINLKRTYAPNMPRVKVVPDQIKQVILNIVQNADDAITGNDGEITISTDYDHNHIYIHVKDNGEGITKQFRSAMFEPFVTSKSAVKGTGLGLSICYGIIKKHKGDISVKSRAGKGTTFTIALPK